MKPFNFFEILGKDNKELVHSAFISYLIYEVKNFRAYLNLPDIDLDTPTLERARKPKNGTLKKYKRGVRIDVEIQSKDEKHLVLIENKFKSAPDQSQLDTYDKIYKNNFDGLKVSIHKLLFCFDKSLANIKSST